MAATDLTPELLAQLERTALHFTAAGGFDDDIQVAEALAAIPALVAAAKERDQLRSEISSIRGALDAHGHDGTFEAAAKLRDEVVRLRAEVAAPETTTIKWDSTAEVLMADYGRRTIRQLHDRYFEALSLESENDKLSAEVERLRSGMETMACTAPPIVAREIRRRLDGQEETETPAEVERLLKLGIESLVLLDAVAEGEPWARKAIDGELPRLRAEIERKP